MISKMDHGMKQGFEDGELRLCILVFNVKAASENNDSICFYLMF